MAEPMSATGDKTAPGDDVPSRRPAVAPVPPPAPAATAPGAATPGVATPDAVPPGAVVPGVVPSASGAPGPVSGWSWLPSSAVPGPMVPPPVLQRRPVLGVRWPGPGRVAPLSALGAAGAAGVAAAVTLPWDRPGIGWLLTGTVAAAGTAAATVLTAQASAGVPAPVGAPASVGVPDSADSPVPAAAPGSAAQGRSWRGGRFWSLVGRVAWAVVALALLAVGAVRGAGWLFVLCVLSAWVAGSVAVAGGRSAQGLFLSVMSVPVATARALPWAGRGLAQVPGRVGGSAVRTTAAVAVSAALLLIFGALFAGADAAFAKLLDTMMPTVDFGAVFRWVFFFVLLGLGTLGGCFLALRRPELDTEPSVRRPLRRIEWALPVGLLALLFGAFVAVQLTALFGGREYVLRTANLTYAEYARSGFGQLLAVTILTLAVIGVAARLASRETAADRVWLRAVLGGLAVLTLVIVASALSRMWAYEEAYGFTRLRLLVSACELWLGVVFLLVIAAGIRLGPVSGARWLPGAIVGTGLVALLVLAGLNPDRFIADHNVTRYEQTGRVDVDYLSELSPDAVPALARLPEPLRACALDGIADGLAESGSDAWHEWNYARSEARRLLAGFVGPTLTQRQTCRQVSGTAER